MCDNETGKAAAQQQQVLNIFIKMFFKSFQKARHWYWQDGSVYKHKGWKNHLIWKNYSTILHLWKQTADIQIFFSQMAGEGEIS